MTWFFLVSPYNGFLTLDFTYPVYEMETVKGGVKL